MGVKSGKCFIIIDGQTFDELVYAMTLEKADYGYGFVSGPLDLLKAARMAKRVQIVCDDEPPKHIAILQVVEPGVALITIRS